MAGNRTVRRRLDQIISILKSLDDKQDARAAAQARVSKRRHLVGTILATISILLALMAASDQPRQTPTLGVTIHGPSKERQATENELNREELERKLLKTEGEKIALEILLDALRLEDDQAQPR